MRLKMLTPILALLMCVGLQAQGFLDAFSKTGPGRLKADVEDTVEPDGFLMIFGEEPPPFGVGGRRVKLSDMAKAVQWRQNRASYKGLLDIEIDADRLMIVMDETGGVPIAWESTAGRQYIAVVGTGVQFTHMSLSTFLSLSVPAVGQTVGHMLIMRGACLDPVPARYNSIYQERNAKNCEK